MKNLTFTYLFILLFFTGCGTSNSELFPDQKFTDTEKTLWDCFILSSSEFPVGLALRHQLKEPFIARFQTQNPGFINIKEFKKSFPKHPLTELNRWYQGLFYHTNYTLSYMVLSFPLVEGAKAYLPHLREIQTKTKKIYRINRHLIVFDLRDNDNQSMDYDPSHPVQLWIKKHMQTISE